MRSTLYPSFGPTDWQRLPALARRQAVRPVLDVHEEQLTLLARLLQVKTPVVKLGAGKDIDTISACDITNMLDRSSLPERRDELQALVDQLREYRAALMEKGTDSEYPNTVDVLRVIERETLPRWTKCLNDMDAQVMAAQNRDKYSQSFVLKPIPIESMPAELLSGAAQLAINQPHSGFLAGDANEPALDGRIEGPSAHRGDDEEGQDFYDAEIAENAQDRQLLPEFEETTKKSLKRDG